MRFARVFDRGITALLVVSLASMGMGLAAQTVPQTTTPLSPRNANYAIEVTLDAAARTLSGTQLVEWRNIQERPTDELWFHLYWNAWRNDRSTWMVEDSIRERSSNRSPRDGDWSYLTIDSTRLLPGNGWEEADLEPTLRISSTNSNIPISIGVPAITLGRGGAGDGGHALSEWWVNHDGTTGIKRVLLILTAEAGVVELVF